MGAAFLRLHDVRTDLGISDSSSAAPSGAGIARGHTTAVAVAIQNAADPRLTCRGSGEAKQDALNAPTENRRETSGGPAWPAALVYARTALRARGVRSALGDQCCRPRRPAGGFRSFFSRGRSESVLLSVVSRLKTWVICERRWAGCKPPQSTPVFKRDTTLDSLRFQLRHAGDVFE